MKDLIYKFWEGSATIKECKTLLKQMQEQDGEFKKQLEQAFTNGIINDREHLSKERLELLLRNIKASANIPLPEKPGKHKIVSRLWITWAAAASLLLVFSFGLIRFLDKTPIAATIARSTPVQLKKWIKVSSGDQLLNLNLPDGSTVVLKRGTKLQYHPDFGSLSRSITMTQGAATFKVRKNKMLPFIVSMNGVSTTALGTEFMVNDYEQDKVIVKLLEGRVVVAGATKSGHSFAAKYLKAGESVEVNYIQGTSALFRLKSTEPKSKISFEKQSVVPVLHFNRTALSLVFDELEKDYGITLDYEAVSLQGLSFTGDFQKSDSLDFILTNICELNELTYTKNGLHYQIQSKN